MCLLIVKPAGKIIPEVFYLNGFLNNKDGCGVSFVKDKKLVVQKGLFKFDDLYAIIKANEQLEMVIHFRASSFVNDVTPEMAHPFLLDTPHFDEGTKDQPTEGFRFSLSHNGKLDWRSTIDESDTFCFAQDLIEPHLNRDPWFFDSETGKMMIERIIGKSNKIAIQRYDIKKDKVTTYILNEEGGYEASTTSSGHCAKAHWVDGSWFSNHSYKDPIPKKVTTTVTEYYGHNSSIKKWMQKNGVVDFFPGDDDGVPTKGAEVKEPSQSHFSTPDSGGWYWEYEIDSWKNEKTGHVCAHLQTRPIRPPYMILRERAQAQGKNGAPAFTRGVDNQDDSMVDLSHLDNFDRKILRRAAADYANSWGGDTKLNNGEMITWARNDIRENVEFALKFTPQEIDKLIVKMVKAGRTIHETIGMATETERMN